MKLLEHFKEISLHPKNAEELKGLILKLAVQGKLTATWRENNPNTEPASVLLDKVEKQKAVLIEEKKIRNVKSVPIDNELRNIPDTWAWTRMIDYLDVRDGTHDSPKYVSDGFPLVTSKNLYTKKLDMTNVKYISKKDHDEISKRSKVDRNDILFAMIGTIGNPVIVDIEPNFSIKNVALIKYYEDGFCEPNYILNFLENATNEFKADSDGAVQSFVSLKKLRLKEIPVPPLEEQKAIVEVVNTLFAEVEQLESLTKERIQLKESFVVSALNKLTESENTQEEWNFLQPHFSSFFTEKKNIKSLRETILQLAVQGKLTAKWRANNPNTEPASELLKRIEAEKQQLIAEKKIKKEKPLPPIVEDEMPYELPHGWVWCRLGTYTHNFGQKKPDKAFEYIDVASIDNHLGVISSDLNVVKASEAPSRARKIIEKGCVIYSTVRPYLLNIACVDRDFEFEAIASTAFAILNPIQECSPRYLYYTLRSPFYIEYVESFMKGVAYPAINDKNLLSGPIPVPPLEEQKVIVEKVNSLMALCDELEQQIDNSQTQIEQLMQSCLKEVFEYESN